CPETKMRPAGRRPKLGGIEMNAPRIEFNMTKWPVRARGKEIGRVTSAIHSPRLKKNIGYAMVPIAFSDTGTEVEVIHLSGTRKARVVKKPFIDPGKAIPKASTTLSRSGGFPRPFTRAPGG